MVKFKNNNFYGKVNEHSMMDFVKELDYTIESTDGRIEYIKERLNTYEVDGVEFYDEFFDVIFDQESKEGKIDLILNTDKTLYSESNIALGLEILGSYILNSAEEKKNKKDGLIDYKIYNSKEMFNRAVQEENLIFKLSTVNSDKSNNYEYNNSNDYNDPRRDMDREGLGFAIFQLPKNYKKVKDIIIENKDFKKYPILEEYQNAIDNMKKIYDEVLKIDEKAIKDEKERTELRKFKNMIRRNLKSLKLDMLDAKKLIQQPIIWKAPLKDSGSPSWDELDMFNKEHVKELLRVKKGNDLQDDISCIIQDLNNLINKIEFTNRQKIILDMWSSGYGLKSISEEMNVSRRVVNGVLNKIVNMIIQKYEEEYTDWYYLNICKGRYKKCSKCGEIKLSIYFAKNGKGLRGNCKKCR